MEGLQLHRGLNKAQAREEAINMLRMVKIPVPEKNVDSYPHHSVARAGTELSSAQV